MGDLIGETAPPLMRTRVDGFFFPPQPRPTMLRYAYAGFSVAASFGCRVALIPLLSAHSPLLIFTIPVVASAVAVGFGPAIFATILSAAVSIYLFPPLMVFSIAPEYRGIGVFEIAVFCLFGVLTAKLGGALRDKRWMAEAAAEALRKALVERDAAQEKVRVLSGLLPICAGCKSIRDKNGNWRRMEDYISEHSEAEFTHGMCPNCLPLWFEQ